MCYTVITVSLYIIVKEEIIMKKPMEQLKEIMGVKEQSAEKGTPKELLEVKRQIKNLLNVIKIIKALVIIAVVGLVLGGAAMLLDNAVSPDPEIAVEIYKLIQYVITAAVAWYICSVCGGFCKEICKSNTPFIPQVPKGLRKISAALAVMYIISFLASVAYSLLTHTELNIYVDGTLAMFILVLVILSSIFDYGCKLQKESDETL